MPDVLFALSAGTLFVVGMASVALAAEFRDWRYLIGYFVALAASCGLVVGV